MKLIFKQQPYQTDATMALVRCFEGQGRTNASSEPLEEPC